MRSANFPWSSLVVFFDDHVTCLWQAIPLELCLYLCQSPLVHDSVEGY